MFSLVHGLEDEPELLGCAHESDDVLEGEVDDAKGVDHVQDGNNRRVTHHFSVLVLVAMRILLRQGGLGTCIMQNVCIFHFRATKDASIKYVRASALRLGGQVLREEIGTAVRQIKSRADQFSLTMHGREGEGS